MATRRERVILDLEDNFTSKMARAAASAALLNKELGSLSGSSVRSSGIDKASKDIDKVGASSRNAGSEIDRFGGRLTLLRDAALTLGPAFVPIGAVAVPAITGLAAQMGAAAIAGGTMIAAFQGVGTALEAVNKASIEPTAENLEAARIAMQNLSPAAASFVREIQSMRPAFADLRDAAAAGLFPGLERSLDELESTFPRIERVLFAVGDAAGDLADNFAEGLAGERGQEFLAFIEAEVPSALSMLGRTVGNVAAGMAELWMAFTPVNNDFAGWMLDASRSFDRWAAGLSQTQGFNDFVAYLRENGPRVADAMGAIGNAVLQLVQAAAPLGGPTLAALEAFANVVAAVADSSYGPALVALASGLALVSRAAKTLDALKASSLFTGLTGAAGGAASSLTRVQGAGVAAAVGITAAVAAGNKLVDLFREDLPGVQQLTGMLMDLSAGDAGALPDEFDSLAASVERITNPSLWKGQQTSDTILGLFGAEGRTLTNATDEVEALEAALTNMISLQGPEAAEEAFAALAADAGLGADQIAQLRDLMPGYTDALAGAENQQRALGEAGTQSGREIAAGFNQGTSAAQEFRAAVEAANAALTGRSTMRDYEAALDAAQAPKKDFVLPSGEFNIDLKGGREAEAQIDAIASSALSAAENLRGMDRKNFLQNARADLIATARQFGMTKAQAQSLADELGLLDRKNAKPKVTLLPGTTPAETASLMRGLEALDNKHAKPTASLDYSDVQAGVNAVTSLLNSLSGRSVQTTVTTNYQSTGNPGGPFGTRHGVATGGYITGPGTGTSDDIPAWLSNGEFVLKAAAVQRYGVEFLHQLNAMRFAQGGLVSSQVQRQSSRPPSVSVSAPNVNVGGAAVRVFIDGREVRATVRSEMASAARYDRRLEDR